MDDPTETVVMHRSEPSRLQSLALQLSDKVNNFVDSNERIFEMKQGSVFKHSMYIVYIFYHAHIYFYNCVIITNAEFNVNM